MEDTDLRLASANLTISLVLGTKNTQEIAPKYEDLPSLEVLEEYTLGFYNFLKYGKFDLSKKG